MCIHLLCHAFVSFSLSILLSYLSISLTRACARQPEHVPKLVNLYDPILKKVYEMNRIVAAAMFAEFINQQCGGDLSLMNRLKNGLLAKMVDQSHSTERSLSLTLSPSIFLCLALCLLVTSPSLFAMHACIADAHVRSCAQALYPRSRQRGSAAARPIAQALDDSAVRHDERNGRPQRPQ